MRFDKLIGDPFNSATDPESDSLKGWLGKPLGREILLRLQNKLLSIGRRGGRERSWVKEIVRPDELAVTQTIHVNREIASHFSLYTYCIEIRPFSLFNVAIRTLLWIGRRLQRLLPRIGLSKINAQESR